MYKKHSDYFKGSFKRQLMRSLIFEDQAHNQYISIILPFLRWSVTLARIVVIIPLKMAII